MSNPNNQDAAKAAALAIIAMARIIATAQDTRRQGPAPETVTA